MVGLGIMALRTVRGKVGLMSVTIGLSTVSEELLGRINWYAR